MLMNQVYFYFLDDKCNDTDVGVLLKNNNIDYPLTCTSELCREEFLINNPEDWLNKAHKYVLCLEESIELMKKIRSKKQ